MLTELIHRTVHALVVLEPHRRYKEVAVTEQILLTQTTTEDEVFDLLDAWAEVNNAADDGGWRWGRRKVARWYLGVRQIEIVDPGSVLVTEGEIELAGAAGRIRLAYLSSFSYTVRREHLATLLDGTTPVELWATPIPAE